MSSVSLCPKTGFEMRKDLIDAASKLDEALVKEISGRINWLYLNQPMLSAYQDAINAIDVKRTDTKAIADQKRRMYSILDRARAEFIRKEEFHECWYDSD